MKTCSTCSQEVQALITNVQTGQQFCDRCSSTVCPTFMPGLVYTLEDLKFLRECGIDPEVGKIEDYLKDLTEHCKRPSGTERAWFRTREDAIEFAATNPAYHGDIPALCARCDAPYHLNRPEWLEPILTARDAQFLEDIGVTAPQRMDDYFRCVICGTVQRDGIEFLILEDGKMVCGTSCMPQND